VGLGKVKKAIFHLIELKVFELIFVKRHSKEWRFFI
jgi:hypothetical protein